MACNSDHFLVGTELNTKIDFKVVRLQYLFQQQILMNFSLVTTIIELPPTTQFQGKI